MNAPSIVAAYASTCPGPLVLTSDPQDLAALAQYATRTVSVASV